MSWRILTYNTQLRSDGMEVLAQKNPFPHMSVEQRAVTIAKRILESAPDYDVICLNEVFDEDGRAIFEQLLLPAYPNAVLKADLMKLEVRQQEPTGLFGVLPLPPAPWSLGIGFDPVNIFEILQGKLEDSGLMFFSRFPFATVPPTPDLLPIFDGLGLAHPSQVPVVLFCAYPDSDFDDSLASKGVIYARLRAPNERPLHLLMSHTQADSTGHIREHEDTRRKQFALVSDILVAMAGPPPFAEEVVFCGDFNVNGLAQHGAKANEEAIALFGHPASTWRKDMHDVWWWEQCPGEPSPSNHMPPDCDPGMSAPGQRLDYFLRPAPFPGRLAAQHVCIAWNIAQSPAGVAPTLYTSDHLPLQIDLGDDRPRASTARAEQLTPTIAHPDVQTPRRGLVDGQMDWYVLTDSGSFGIGLSEGAGQVAVEVYTADNLSRPAAPFTTTREQVNESPPLTRYALPEPPFFIRVFMLDRFSETSYRLFVHRYTGTSPQDAIGLPRGVPVTFEAKTNVPHSLDRPDTPFNDHDSVWFTATLDDPPATEREVAYHLVMNGIDFIPGTGDHAFGLLAAERRPGGPIEEITEDGGGLDPVLLDFDHPGGARLFVLARRNDPSHQAKRFTITLTSDVSYIYGNPALLNMQAFDRATLFCLDETDGFLGSEAGSDDIAINISSDGQNIFHMDNNDFLEFDDDSTRDLPIEVVRYAGDAVFELVELDDLSPDDRASVTIPSFDRVRKLPQAQKVVENESWVQAKFRIAFDDGEYELTCVVAREPPPGA
jgi:Endonuclease/Exonuclease/phosphatase family